MDNILIELQNKISYNFKDINLLKLALTHKGYSERNNQRLEFLGDAVLQICVSDYLYKNFPNMQEGDLTSMRASVVCGKALANVAKTLDLGKYIILEGTFSNSGGRTNSSVLEDAVEALLAAVYLDAGFDEVNLLVQNLWVDIIKGAKPRLDSKGNLQKILQAEGKTPPEYVLIEERGPIHRRIFKMAVLIDGVEIAQAEGFSKKEAEKAAAQMACKILETEGKR